jgi:hypothetical protein
MKGGTAVAVRQGIPHNRVDLPTGVCILLAGRAWSDADITELLSFRNKCILVGDLNAKHPFWNSRASNPSEEKLLKLFDLDYFEISAPHCQTYYSPQGMETCSI